MLTTVLADCLRPALEGDGRLSVLGTHLVVDTTRRLPSGTRGWYDPKLVRIFLDPRVPRANQPTVLLHEVLHFINDVLKLELTHNQVASLATALGSIRCLASL